MGSDNYRYTVQRNANLLKKENSYIIDTFQWFIMLVTYGHTGQITKLQKKTINNE